MPAGVQGTLNKAFVSAISFLDQRDINPNLIDQSRDAAFTDIMKLVGRYKEAKVPIYNYFVNNDVFADGVVASVSSGYGTAIMVVVLTSASSGYARIGDLVRSSNPNMVGQQALVTQVTSVSGVDTVKLQSVNNNPLYAVANDNLAFSSNAFGEESTAPPNRKYGVTRYINQVQVFREVDEITDIQKASKVEISINGQPYYTPLNHIYKLKSLNGFISSMMIAGVQSITLFSDSSPYLTDVNGNPVQTTMGMDQYITTYGATNQVATLGTVAFSDVNSMIDSFLANKAPHEQMGFLGSRAKRPFDVWLKNLGSSGVNSVRLIIDGKDVNMEVDRFSYGNFEFEFIYLPIFDHPVLFGPTITPDINGSVYWIPKDKVQVEGGGMEPRLQIRYLPKAMAGGNTMSNGIITEWHTGALAPIPTSSQMLWHTDWYTVQGLEMLGVKHMQKFRVA
jgi:hypothetical protein